MSSKVESIRKFYRGTGSPFDDLLDHIDTIERNEVHLAGMVADERTERHKVEAENARLRELVEQARPFALILHWSAWAEEAAAAGIWLDAASDVLEKKA